MAFFGNDSNGIISNGSIILFTGGFTPTPPTPPPVPSPGDQPIDQKMQGYPPLRGLLVISSSYSPQMGVHVNEFSQDYGFRVGNTAFEKGVY